MHVSLDACTGCALRSGAVLADKELKLLPREAAYSRISGVWNLSGEAGACMLRGCSGFSPLSIARVAATLRARARAAMLQATSARCTSPTCASCGAATCRRRSTSASPTAKSSRCASRTASLGPRWWWRRAAPPAATCSASASTRATRSTTWQRRQARCCRCVGEAYCLLRMRVDACA